jgi:hypothetical protein
MWAIRTEMRAHAKRTTYKTFDKIYEINSKNTFTRGMGTLGHVKTYMNKI